MTIFQKILLKIRNKTSVVKEEVPLLFDYSGQAAADYIYKTLSEDKPVMIGRYGSTEMLNIVMYLSIISDDNILNKTIKFIKGQTSYFWFEKIIADKLCHFSGFFPNNEQLIIKFCQLMLDSSKNLDILGSWLADESKLDAYLKNVARIPLSDLDPYINANPWSRALEGKKVLVIHPFEETILQQYKNRELLFENKNILPAFELKTIKAVQSIAGNQTDFKTWFDALEYMKSKIRETDFDIAIIGCGAYGFPLASYVKDLGKKAVHLGGSTQLLFGIKGKRWEDREDISPIFNKYWVYPNEKPENFETIEGGCYW